MGGGALLILIWAIRGNHFRNFEDVKYQVFWSDLQDLVNKPHKEQEHGRGAKKA